MASSFRSQKLVRISFQIELMEVFPLRLAVTRTSCAEDAWTALSCRSSEIGQATSTIGQALRNQYLIGYVPHDTHDDGRWLSMQVKLNLRNRDSLHAAGVSVR